MRKVKGRAAVGAAIGLAGLALANGADALMVTYEWVPTTNSNPVGGVGTITLDSASITDGANFNNIAANSLVSFDYTWNNGATFSSSDPFAYTTAVSAPGWSASGGFLTTVFQIASNVAGSGTRSLDGNAYNPVFPTFGTSSNGTNTWASSS